MADARHAGQVGQFAGQFGLGVEQVRQVLVDGLELLFQQFLAGGQSLQSPGVGLVAVVVRVALGFEPGALPLQALALPRQGPQLAQRRRGRLPGGQGPLQAQAAEQASVQLVGLALLLGALSKILTFWATAR